MKRVKLRNKERANYNNDELKKIKKWHERKRRRKLTDIVIKKRFLFLNFLNSLKNIKKTFLTFKFKRTRLLIIILNFKNKYEWM